MPVCMCVSVRSVQARLYAYLPRPRAHDNIVKNLQNKQPGKKVTGPRTYVTPCLSGIVIFSPRTLNKTINRSQDPGNFQSWQRALCLSDLHDDAGPEGLVQQAMLPQLPLHQLAGAAHHHFRCRWVCPRCWCKNITAISRRHRLDRWVGHGQDATTLELCFVLSLSECVFLCVAERERERKKAKRKFVLYFCQALSKILVTNGW